MADRLRDWELLGDAPRLAGRQISIERLVGSLWLTSPSFNMMRVKTNVRCDRLHRVLHRLCIHLPLFTIFSLVFAPSHFHQPEWHGLSHYFWLMKVRYISTR